VNEGVHLTLYEAAEIEAKLDRMAAGLCACVDPARPTVLVGVRRRGVPLAAAINTRLATRFGSTLPTVELAIERYADDLTLLHPETRLTEDEKARKADLAGKTVVVVDDVLYQGHSLLRAVEYLRVRGAATIRTAVLVDRNVARLPVRADVTGMVLEVAPGDVVECQVPPFEPVLRIQLWRKEGR